MAPTSVDKLRFSFTAASLLLKETLAVTEELIRNDFEWERVNALILSGKRSSTHTRQFREIKLRLEQLSQEELLLLNDASRETQRQLCFVAFCRTYRYVGDFVVDVLLEKIQQFDNTLSDMDYHIYLAHKSMDYPELEQLTDGTKQKIKQRLLTVLEQAGIINSVKGKHIQRPLLELPLENLLLKNRPTDLKFLLYSSDQIASK